MQFVLKRSLVAGLVVLAGAAHSSDSLPLVKGQGAPAMARGWIVLLGLWLIACGASETASTRSSS